MAQLQDLLIKVEGKQDLIKGTIDGLLLGGGQSDFKPEE